MPAKAKPANLGRPLCRQRISLRSDQKRRPYSSLPGATARSCRGRHSWHQPEVMVRGMVRPALNTRGKSGDKIKKLLKIQQYQ
jgi:hypothetical protein